MQPLFESPLVAAAAHLDKPAVIGMEHVWSWRQIHEASLALSQRLGHASAVCNLCTSRVSFLVTWLATLRRRGLLVLPPSGGNADLAAVLAAAGRPIVVVDDPRSIPSPWRESADCVVYRPTWALSNATDDALAWQPVWADIAVLLYTSGSTGTPEPQPKTLRQLARGAQVLGARLAQDVEGGIAAIQRIVCSVPPQHMFGVEASVMLSLVHAIPVLDGRPLLPADVRDAFAGSPASAWIATPLHLRSQVQAAEPVPHCSVVVASTMPLTPTLAQQAEQLVNAPVLEIYGSTETGVLAMRRPAHEVQWRPVQGVRLEPHDHVTRAWGSHFASPVDLPDQVEIDADGRVTLLGRQADLIKIAGRRASLAGLNVLLQELPGLEDGVFYLPTTDRSTERLCLIHSGPAPDRAAMHQWLRARLDPVFLPRTLIRVDRLPRSDTGKLPRRALDQVYAQWLANASPPQSQWQFSVPSHHPALAGHFPGRPIVPGVLLLDHVLAGLGTRLDHPVALLQQVKFVSALLPDEVALVDLKAQGQRVVFAVKTWRAGVMVPLAHGSLLLDAAQETPQ